MKTYQYTQFLQSPLMERFMANASEIFDYEDKLSVLVKQNPERFKILQEKNFEKSASLVSENDPKKYQGYKNVLETISESLSSSFNETMSLAENQNQKLILSIIFLLDFYLIHPFNFF